jgi:hypothetical protein
MFGLSAFQSSRRASAHGVVHPVNLLPEAQSLLSALADLEYRYETAHRFMAQWPGPDEVKQSCLRTIAESHGRERGQLVRRLAELDRRLAPVRTKTTVHRLVADPEVLLAASA